MRTQYPSKKFEKIDRKATVDEEIKIPTYLRCCKDGIGEKFRSKKESPDVSLGCHNSFKNVRGMENE